MARWSYALVCLLLAGLAGTFVAGSYLQGQAPVPLAVPKEITSYRDVVKKVLPAVVSIETKVKPKPVKAKQQPRKRPKIDNSQVPEEFRKYFEDFGQFEMPEEREQPHMGFGSGFIVDPKGVILTNNHVVDGADQVEVELKDGRKFVSKEIHTDAKTDLAIVRIDAKGTLPYLELGDSDAMEIGDRVLAVGAPFGLTGSVTAGIVSAKGRNLQMNMYEDFLQTDAAINPGNSGGPLVNLEGKVIGINSAIKSRSGGFQGVGMAISSNMAQHVMEQLLKHGTVHRGYLGIQMQELDAEVASRLGVPNDKGVLVAQVFEGAPADKAGVKEGDVITGLAGKPITDGRALQRTVATLPLKKPVDVNVLRDGKEKTLQVTIEEQPKDFGSARLPAQPAPRAQKKESIALDKFGVELTDATPEMAEQLGFKGKVSGAVITQVDPDSPAAEAGLRKGLVIVKVEKKAIESAAEAKTALEKASLDKGVLLQVQTPQGGTRYVVVKALETK